MNELKFVLMATKNGFINLISLLLAGGLFSCLATVIHTIRPGDQHNASDYLVSASGMFTLGFFGVEFSENTYLGIWYTQNNGTTVWIANRDEPIINKSGVLIIDTTGKLMIQSKGRQPIPLNSDQGSGNVTATLQDSGNFLLFDEIEKRVLWQSFDYPTDTLLPGMKLGVNLKTGRNWTLTSWLRNDFDPASGAFTLSWEPTQDSGQLVIRLRGMLYWASGVLTNQSFEFMPGLNTSSYHHNLSYESNQDEKCLKFSSPYYLPQYFSNISRWVLKSDAKFVDAGNATLNGLTGFCNGYGGCASAMLPKCRGQDDRFERRSGGFLYASSNSIASSTPYGNSSLGLGDCWAKCWNDCNCEGFDDYGVGCSMWSGNLKFDPDLSGHTAAHYVLVPAANSSAKGNKRVWIIIAIAIPLILILLSFLGCLIKRKQRQKGEEKRRQEAMLHELTTADRLHNANEVENNGKEGRDLKIFSFASIMAATNNFAFENKLGQGGFGPVYKGELPEGRKIAVKRLSSTSRQGLVEFKNELILITKLQHVNLVRVLGCCIHGEEKMLVYEYMSNKSLDSYLFDPIRRELLDWKKRFNIIEGVAQGLLYLHKYSRLRIIHRDLKASNILLDDNMTPKISDFGMARIFDQNETEANTRRPVGTYGYMSPEYAMEGTFSIKSDVFSFGVLLLEIMSGKKNTSFHHFDRPLNLIGYAWELWNEEVALELVDPALGESCPTNQLLRIIHLGLLCVQENATDRPTISDVVSMLRNETMPLPVSKEPAFFTGRSVMEVHSLEGKSKDCSVNGLSMSTMEAR